MNRKRRIPIRRLIGVSICLISIPLGLYVGGWLMFIQPILECCKAFDLDTLTGMMVGTTVLKCIFASFVCGIIIYIGALMMQLFDSWEMKYRRKINKRS